MEHTSFKANGSKVLSGAQLNQFFFFFVELAVIQVFHTIASCVEILTGPSAAQLTVTLCIELN